MAANHTQEINLGVAELERGITNLVILYFHLEGAAASPLDVR